MVMENSVTKIYAVFRRGITPKSMFRYSKNTVNRFSNASIPNANRRNAKTFPNNNESLPLEI